MLLALCPKNQSVKVSCSKCVEGSLFFYGEGEYVSLHYLHETPYQLQGYTLHGWKPFEIRPKKREPKRSELPQLYFCFKCNVLFDGEKGCFACFRHSMSSFFIQPCLIVGSMSDLVQPSPSRSQDFQPSQPTLEKIFPHWRSIKPLPQLPPKPLLP